jgi:two-component system LytT family response regulator
MRNLSKAITPDLLQAVLQKFSPTPEIGKPAPQRVSAAQRIFIQDGEHCWIVRVADIVLLESEGNYTRVHFGKSRPLVARSLNYMEERLDPAMFFRANRHTIINMQYVEDIAPWVNGGFLVRLDSGSEIEVSRRQGQLLKEQLTL